MSQIIFELKNKYRRIAFTLKNWQDIFETQEEIEKYLQKFDFIKKFILGFEINEIDKTSHIKGLLKFIRPISGNKIRTIFNQADFKKVINEENYIEYCKNNNNFIIFGDFSKKSKKINSKITFEKFLDIIDKENLQQDEVFSKYRNLFIKFNKKLLIYFKNKNLQNSKKIRDIQVFFISGNNNIEKNTFLETCFKKVLSINAGPKNPWNHYYKQKVVILKNYNNHFPISELKQIADKYPFDLSANYNNRKAIYNIIFFTSNLSFNEAMFQKNYSEDDKNSIKRRFEDIFENIQTQEEIENTVKKIITKIKNKELLNEKGLFLTK